MGVMTRQVMLTKSAQEALNGLRNLIGDKAGVDLMVNANDPTRGTVTFQFDDVETARQNSGEMQSALREAGFDTVAEPTFMSRKFD